MRKKPAEVFIIMGEFAANMASSESISSYAVTCVDRDGLAHADMITEDTIAERTRISMKIQDGTVALSPYMLSILAITDLGQKFQIDEGITVY